MNKKHFYLLVNLVRIDIGIKGLLKLVILSTLPAVSIAFARSNGSTRFDYHLFWVSILVIAGFNTFSNWLSSNHKLHDYFSPRSGRKWQLERKAQLSGVIKSISLQLNGVVHIDSEKAKELLIKLLDIIVLHVKDYRGSHNANNIDVFANILIAEGDQLTVVVRDSNSSKAGYTRKAPESYPKASLLCGRAMVAKKTLSIGDLKTEYPESPPKPYKSILAVPLLSTASDIYGCLSIDCSRSYFFQSFTCDTVENRLENTLMPYLKLITLVYEKLNGKKNTFS